ncbi:MAG: response regulator [Deltaproteobacteria bacterium]
MLPRLLATDADPYMRQIYHQYFPNFGFEIATASDGVDCLSAMREFHPDALVLDLELLWGGAEGVLADLRENSQAPPIPVVLTTRWLRSGHPEKHVVPPVVKLLEKPFRLRDLRSVVEAVLAVTSQLPASL